MQDINFQMQFICTMAFLHKMETNAGNINEKLGVSEATADILREYGENLTKVIDDMSEENFKQHLKFYLESLAADILVAKTLQKYD